MANVFATPQGAASIFESGTVLPKSKSEGWARRPAGGREADPEGAPAPDAGRGRRNSIGFRLVRRDSEESRRFLIRVERRAGAGATPAPAGICFLRV